MNCNSMVLSSSSCMCVCVWVCACVCVCERACASVCTHMHAWFCAWMCQCVCVCVHTRTFEHLCMPECLCMHLCVCVCCVHACACVWQMIDGQNIHSHFAQPAVHFEGEVIWVSPCQSPCELLEQTITLCQCLSCQLLFFKIYIIYIYFCFVLTHQMPEGVWQLGVFVCVSIHPSILSVRVCVCVCVCVWSLQTQSPWTPQSDLVCWYYLSDHFVWSYQYQWP